MGHGETATLTAQVTYPYVDPERAAMALRADLRHRAAEAGATPDWSTLSIEGPTETCSTHGRTWFGWVGTVQA